MFKQTLPSVPSVAVGRHGAFATPRIALSWVRFVAEKRLILLNALSTGHAGSLTTMDPNSAHDTLSRIVTLVKRGDVNLPHDVIVDMVGRSIDVVFHLGHRVRAEALRDVSDDNKRILTEPI